MKKILVLCSLFSLGLLIACSSNTTTTPSITTTTTTTVSQELSENEFKIDVKEGKEVLKEKKFNLDALKEKTLFEIVCANFDVKYTTSEYGVFINEIEGLKGKDLNYYVQVSINNIPSEVGISEVVVKGRDLISFSISTFLSEFDQKIDDIVYNFIENKMKSVDNIKVDYMLLSALKLMEKNFYNVKVTDYIKEAEYKTYLENLTFGTMNPQNDAYKGYLNSVNTGNDPARFFDFLKNSTVENFSTNAIPFGFIALQSSEASDLKNGLKNKIAAFEPSAKDTDLSLFYLSALSYCKEENFYAEKLNAILDSLFANSGENGFSNWGTFNSNSMALTIIAFASNNIDFINKPEYQIQGKQFAEILMKFYVEETGGFKWDLAANQDNQMSTNQAMSALMIYKLYRDPYIKAEVKLFR